MEAMDDDQTTDTNAFLKPKDPPQISTASTVTGSSPDRSRSTSRHSSSKRNRVSRSNSRDSVINDKKDTETQKRPYVKRPCVLTKDLEECKNTIASQSETINTMNNTIVNMSKLIKDLTDRLSILESKKLTENSDEGLWSKIIEGKSKKTIKHISLLTAVSNETNEQDSKENNIIVFEILKPKFTEYLD